MKNIQEHLKKVADDQCLNGIDTLDDTQRNEADRHYAVSQLLQPGIVTGYYSTAQGRFIPGYSSWRDNMTCESSFTTASAAAFTLTCPAGHRYEVRQAGALNATQLSTTTLSASISGNALTCLGTSSSGTVMQMCIGNGAGTTTSVPQMNSIWLDAGDTLTLTLNTYAGGNDTEHFFIYNDHTL